MQLVMSLLLQMFWFILGLQDGLLFNIMPVLRLIPNSTKYTLGSKILESVTQ
jgi:hypothetical protein